MAGAVAAAGLLPALTWPAQAQAPADPLAPLALDGSPAQAFASHRARANGLAWHFAQTRPVETIGGEANEDNTVALIAHFHVAAITTGPEQAARQTGQPSMAVGTIVQGLKIFIETALVTKQDLCQSGGTIC